ncbi:MAG: hypothetical protein M9945_14295 [Aquamicrobium sp.]|uniref:hypothetical protein n=1 Tax=Aquamicrobium sp. TaxID=1872579 RepID=UPI00349ECDC0|nr:hypothetical protein [Aquamicrobium sp.]
MHADPYKDGVLVKEHHERLVADIDNFALDAGIKPHWIYRPLPDDFTKREIDYLKAFRKHIAGATGVSGIVYSGPNGAGKMERRMAAMAGALVRNFIRSRVMTLGTVLDLLASKQMPEITCILIPNFFYTQAEGGTIASWQTSALLDFLSHRQVTGQQTVLYASNKDSLRKEYGLGFGAMISEHFLDVEI